MWRVGDVIEATGGVPARIERDAFTAISTDSRTIGAGDLFVPLSGANFDGHLYINEAYEISRGGSICEKRREEICKVALGTVILVDDAIAGPSRPCPVEKGAYEREMHCPYREQRKDDDQRDTRRYDETVFLCRQ